MKLRGGTYGFRLWGWGRNLASIDKALQAVSHLAHLFALDLQVIQVGFAEDLRPSEAQGFRVILMSGLYL